MNILFNGEVGPQAQILAPIFKYRRQTTYIFSDKTSFERSKGLKVSKQSTLS
jgi:hypothetical protein